MENKKILEIANEIGGRITGDGFTLEEQNEIFLTIQEYIKKTRDDKILTLLKEAEEIKASFKVFEGKQT